MPDPTPEPVEITGTSIKLGQFLKLVNLIDQGSDVKLLLADDRVTVNGEVEGRRGRQLVDGDVVAVDEMAFAVVAQG